MNYNVMVHMSAMRYCTYIYGIVTEQIYLKRYTTYSSLA